VHSVSLIFDYNDDQVVSINITPVIGIMLVILVIFMVMTPMLTTGTNAQLPESKSGSILQSSEALVVTMNFDGHVEFEKQIMHEDALRFRLQQLVIEDQSRPILVRADSRIPYGRVVLLVDIIRESGFTQVDLATQPVVNVR